MAVGEGTANYSPRLCTPIVCEFNTFTVEEVVANVCALAGMYVAARFHGSGILGVTLGIMSSKVEIFLITELWCLSVSKICAW